jgi:hypothetical protein
MSAPTMTTPSSSGVPATSGEADIAKHWIKNGMGHLLYRLDASIRVEGSHSRAIADIVEQEWRNAHPDEPILRRHIGVEPIPATAWATAVSASRKHSSRRKRSASPISTTQLNTGGCQS